MVVKPYQFHVTRTCSNEKGILARIFYLPGGNTDICFVAPTFFLQCRRKETFIWGQEGWGSQIGEEARSMLVPHPTIRKKKKRK